MNILNTYLPSPQLSPFILYYWVLETAGNHHASERVIPFGNVQIIFHREYSIYSTTNKEFQPGFFVSGMRNHYDDIISPKKVNMFVVSFRPEGAKAFLNTSLKLCYNCDISIDDFEDKELTMLGKQISSEGDDRQCIHLIENFFLHRLKSCDMFNFKRLIPGINSINKNPQVNISTLSSTACLSQKQFNRVFTEHIGTSPKEFQRIVRFQRALYILQNNPDIALTQLAFDAGYYDQPHLIKDFRQFSGYSPREFISICPPVSDYFSYQ